MMGETFLMKMEKVLWSARGLGSSGSFSPSSFSPSSPSSPSSFASPSSSLLSPSEAPFSPLLSKPNVREEHYWKTSSSSNHLDREDKWFDRGVKEAIWERVEETKLNKKGGLGFNLSHARDLAIQEIPSRLSRISTWEQYSSHHFSTLPCPPSPLLPPACPPPQRLPSPHCSPVEMCFKCIHTALKVWKWDCEEQKSLKSD